MADRQSKFSGFRIVRLVLRWLTIVLFCAVADENLDITMNLIKCDNELCREGTGMNQSALSLGASVDELDALGEEMVAAYPHHQIMPECAGVWNIVNRKVCVKRAFFQTVRDARFDVCSWGGHKYSRSGEDSRRRQMSKSSMFGQVESRVDHGSYYFSHYHGDAQAFCQWRWMLGDIWKQRHETPMAVLEIAAADYEGSAASWFLDRFLVAPGGRYLCIVDPSTSRGGRMTDDRRHILTYNIHAASRRAAEAWQLDHPGLEPLPIEHFTRRAHVLYDVPQMTDALMHVRSTAPMADDGGSLFHVIRIETCPATYVEAMHELDLAWGQLHDGGVIIWNAVLDRHNSSTVALESFVTFVKLHRAELEVVWRGFNHVIRKRPGGFFSSTSSLDWLLGGDAIISRRWTGDHPSSGESSSPSSCDRNDNVAISRAIDEWAIAPWGRSADVELGIEDSVAPTDELNILVSYAFFQSWEYEPKEIVGDFSFQSCPFVQFDALRNNESKHTFLLKCPEVCQKLILARSLGSNGQGREALETFTNAIESFGGSGSRCSLTSREWRASVLAIRFARATVLQLMRSCSKLYEAAEEYAAIAEGMVAPIVRGSFGAHDLFMTRVALASALLRMNHNDGALASLKAAWSKVGAVFPPLTMVSLQPRLKSLDVHALLLLAVAARSAGDECLFDTSMKGLHAKAHAWGETHALKALFTWERGAGKLGGGEDPAEALMSYFRLVDGYAVEATRFRPSMSYTQYMPVISLLRAYLSDGMEEIKRASDQRSSAQQGGRVVLLAFYTRGPPYDLGLNLTEAARRFEAITRPFPENGGDEASWLREAMDYADEVVVWSTKDFASDPTFADLSKAWPDHEESCTEGGKSKEGGEGIEACHEGAIKLPSIYTKYKFNCPKHRIGFFGWKARVLQRAYQELLRPRSVTDSIGDGSPDILVYTDIDVLKYPLMSLGLAHGLRPRARAILQAAGGQGADAGHSGWAPLWQSPCSDSHPTKMRLSEHVKRLTVEKIARAKKTPCPSSSEEGDPFSDLRCYGDWILPCANRLVLTRSPHVEKLLSDWIDACLDPSLITHVPLTDFDEDTIEGEQGRLFDGRFDGREIWAANLRSHTAEQAILAVLVRAMVLRGELPTQWPRVWVPQGRTLVGPTINTTKGPLPVFCMDQRVPCGDTRSVGEGENIFSLFY